VPVVAGSLEPLVEQAFARRRAPLEGLAEDTGALAVACREMAGRFARGGRLLVFGNGAGTTDAQHVAVEFVHPVIAGKRALPALSLVSDAATLMGVAARCGLDKVFSHQVDVLGRPDDIALALAGPQPGANVGEALVAARAKGMLTVALTAGGPAGELAADHRIAIASHDPLVVKEGHVTAYHLLWELVHVFLDSPEAAAATSPPTGLEGLYPFLYGGGSDAPSVLEAATESARQKVVEVLALRQEVADREHQALAACASRLAEAFAAGGTLLAFGNGGSSTDAQDVVHTFLDPVPPARPLPALGLTNDVAVLTALSNDVSFDVVFARQLRAFGRAGDIAVALSTSGGSRNVLAALEEAAALGMVTVGLAGYGGGPMAELPGLQHLLTVPSTSVHRVQEVQTTLYHVLWEATAQALSS
jgi:D-sedoheptulose 7-phosphate isomerase